MSDYVQVPTRSLDYLENAIRTVSGQVSAVGNYVAQVDERVSQLRKDFERMMEEQRKQAAFQRAITEVIGVRQELEQRFGNHKLVRDYLLGILQANDLDLVKENTISRCSEELMLSTPQYWLSPCLIALAGWIGNDKKLAERAIIEAVGRNRAKTCLLFALICRRANKNDACFAWLQQYFEEQHPARMKSSIITFIGCYFGGVFGEDKDNICGDTITRWMTELGAGNTEFDNAQKAHWKKFFNDLSPVRTVGNSAEYKTLAEMSPEFSSMEKFIARIEAIEGQGGAKDNFRQILSAPIDRQALVAKIDRTLENLVTEYEEKDGHAKSVNQFEGDDNSRKSEAQLRKEEQYFELVKKYKGDEVAAAKYQKYIMARYVDEPLDLATRLSAAAVDPSVDSSERKAAINLLRGYIVGAYAEYITENKEGYPEQISLKHSDRVAVANAGSLVYKNANNTINWTDTTENAENREELKKSIAKAYDDQKNAELAKVKVPVWTWILLVIPGLLASSKAKKTKADIEAKYDARKAAAVARLDKALTGREQANQYVSEFIGRDNWQTIEIKEGM